MVLPTPLHPSAFDFEAFVDRLYALGHSDNVFNGRLSEPLDARLNWFVLKIAMTELIADLWIDWLHHAAETAALAAQPDS